MHNLKNVFVMREALLIHPGTFSPCVACSSHNITTSKRLLWADKTSMSCSLYPSYAREWQLIRQKSSTSQTAKRTDHNGQSVDCLNGTTLVMGTVNITGYTQITSRLKMSIV